MSLIVLILYYIMKGKFFQVDVDLLFDQFYKIEKYIKPDFFLCKHIWHSI